MALVLSEELDGLIASLKDAKLEYALAGGLAVAVWGAPRVVDRQALIEMKLLAGTTTGHL